MDERDRIGSYEVIVEECKGPNKNKKYVSESWYNADGNCHRLDGPAFTLKDLKGNVVQSEYYRDGNLHREDGPAYMLNDGTSLTEIWYFNGHLNRIKDGPAKTVTHLETGIVTEEVWSVMGLEEGWGGPAIITRSPATGVVTYEHWKKGGRTHRFDGPSLIKRDEHTGQVRCMQWHRDGKLHNENGPASVYYKPDGSVMNAAYYLDGNRVQPQGSELTVPEVG